MGVMEDPQCTTDLRKSMSIFGHNPAARLRAAVRAFRYPSLLKQASTVPVQPEPVMVLIDQLLAGKNALVTGVGRNIGKSIAIELAAHGANVYCTCLEEEMRRTLEREVDPMFPGKIQWLQSDLTSQADNDALIAYFRGKKIRIDIYINNSFSRSEEMEEAFRVNFFGPLQMARRVAGEMINERVAGSILFLTSIHQERVRRILSYSSSKAALKMAIEELAIELAPANIRVNGIAPGYVGEDDDGNPLPHRSTPLAGTSITPRYIARAAVYLSSDYFSKYTTGTVLRVDGGLSLFSHMCLDVSRVRESSKLKHLRG
jgi:NAD(P)-dependent dehydrogenase (short-subunit alcohol dehydrogenase family)